MFCSIKKSLLRTLLLSWSSSCCSPSEVHKDGRFSLVSCSITNNFIRDLWIKGRQWVQTPLVSASSMGSIISRYLDFINLLTILGELLFASLVPHILYSCTSEPQVNQDSHPIVLLGIRLSLDFRLLSFSGSSVP